MFTINYKMYLNSINSRSLSNMSETEGFKQNKK